MATKVRQRQAARRAHPPALVNIYGLSDLTGLPIRSLRTLILKRSIPFMKLGHRTILFEPDEVMRAIRSFKIKPISPNGRSG
jgi:hypothetical protein